MICIKKMYGNIRPHFILVQEKCNRLIEAIRSNTGNVKNLLAKYQPISITQYEIDRCIYTLENISKLETYLEKRAHINVSVFLPYNLPLYSLLLFIIMPST